MRKVKLSEWTKKLDKRTKKQVSILRESRRISIKRKPKSDEDINATIAYIRGKKEQEIREGIVEILGKRRIRLRCFSG